MIEDDIELSSICDVSGSVRFSTNEKRLADCEDDISEGIDSELELADQMPTENELGGGEREEVKLVQDERFNDLDDTVPD